MPSLYIVLIHLFLSHHPRTSGMQCRPAYSHFSVEEIGSELFSDFHGLYRVELEFSYDSKIQSLGLFVLSILAIPEYLFGLFKFCVMGYGCDHIVKVFYLGTSPPSGIC